jgi:hypothetical protein
MAITFNTSALPGGLTGTGLYAHISSVGGPHKVDAHQELAPVVDPAVAPVMRDVAESWFVTYGVIVHKDEASRVADNSAWSNRVPMSQIDRFKLTGMANLDTYPTMAVLYANLKTQIASIATSIADA